MRLFAALLSTLFATPALAHIGHLGEVAGHGHWIAVGGIAIAAGIALFGGRKKKDEDPEDAIEDADDQEEAPA